MNKKSTSTLASATLVGLVLSAAISTGNAQAAPGKVTRLGGSNRYETAAKVATDNWKGGAENVILVAGYGYADALSASLLSKELNAPILLTTGDTLSKDAKDALDKLKPTNVYVLGGTGVISQNVRNEVKKSYTIAKEFKGNTRFDTNKEIADFLAEINKEYAREVLVVNGNEGIADALSVSPISAADGKILLIVGKDPSTAKQAEKFIKEHKSKVTVIGTENMVLKSVAENLNATRVDGGKDRFETNLRILEKFSKSLKGNALYVANGSNISYVDSLIASTLAGKTGSPMILVDGNNSQSTKNAVNHIKPHVTTDLNVVGGTGVVSKEIENKINLQVAREVQAVEIISDKTNVLLNAETKLTVIPKDQHGEFIAVGKDNIEVVPGEHFKGDNVTEVKDKEGKNVVAYEIVLTGKIIGTNDVVVNVKGNKSGKVVNMATNKVTMSVSRITNLIDNISIDTKEANGNPIKTLYSTNKDVKVKLNVVAKNSNKNIIPVKNSQLIWKVDSIEEKGMVKPLTKDVVNVKNGIITVKAGFKGKAVIKVVTDSMKEDTITLNFDNSASVAQKGTVKVIGNEENQVIDANENKEGIQIALDDNKDVKDGEKEGSITFKVIAKDQYGEDFEAKDGVIVLIDGSPVVTKDIKGNTVTLMAKEVGNTDININYAGDTIKLEVSVNEKAVEAAKKNSKNAQK